METGYFGFGTIPWPQGCGLYEGNSVSKTVYNPIYEAMMEYAWIGADQRSCWEDEKSAASWRPHIEQGPVWIRKGKSLDW